VKVLIAEDDQNTLNGLVETIESEGYQTVATRNGKEALELFRQENPDFICLDVMMPVIDGYQVCKEIRKERQDIPIIFISAKSEEIDKVLGLELGADDYIIKPFGIKEVIARIRAVTRRYIKTGLAKQHDEFFKIADLNIHPSELKAERGNKSIELSLRDVKLLKLFSENRGKVLDRDTIFNYVWGMNYFPNSRTLDQHISQLRKRIEKNPKKTEIIKTVHGAGYRYD
jgi:two-component system alkaline phosphatase synthesis response regulator PhoP